MSGAKNKGKPIVIVRKEEVVEGGHHGGAWKVAYADFVTAMMAFFLLMWLLNATTEEQRKGLADYFSPNNVLGRSMSGFGAPFGGRTPNLDGSLASDRGAMQVIHQPPHPMVDADDDEGDTPAEASPAKERGATIVAAQRPPNLQASERPDATVDGKDATAKRPDPAAQDAAERAREERQAFDRAAQQIADAVRSDPAMAELAKQLAIDITPEGLRIQIMDEERRPMFATGSAVLNDRARALLSKVAPVLLKLPESISIAGHTDSTPFRGGDRSNWDLSADRANATRRMLAESGLPEARMRSVTGNADRDPLLPADPLAAANRRIAIVVLREAGVKR